jgi:hypothetical protein
VGFVVDELALGQVFPPEKLRFFPCQFHSTGAALLGKMKKTDLSVHLHHRVAQ